MQSALDDRDADTLGDLVLSIGRFWLFANSRTQGLRWTTRVLDSEVLADRAAALVRAQRAALALHHDPELLLADPAAAVPVLLANGDLAWAVTALMVRALELSAAADGEAAAMAIRAVEVALEGGRGWPTRSALSIVEAASPAGEAGDAVDEAWSLVTATGWPSPRSPSAATSRWRWSISVAPSKLSR